MAQRHVLVTFNHAPHGSSFCAEGLRVVVGVTSGIEEHTVDVLYLGDGVYFALKGLDRSDAARYLDALPDLGVCLKAEKAALKERNISESDLADDVEAVDREQALELIRQADLTIDF